MMNSDRPQVIFLDAVGTIFGVRESVGAVYSQIASQFGVKVEPQIADRAFHKSFTSAAPMTFPGESSEHIRQLEFEWWQNLAVKTFEAAGVFHQFSNFHLFFEALYEHFSTGKPWFVYPEVKPALQKWRNNEIALGVLSNFDSRLYPVLQALDLADFFTSITISTEVGAAKPNGQIFSIALEKHKCLPSDALHIGDSYTADYQGALAAGLKAVWLDRHGQSQQRSAFIWHKLCAFA